MVLRAALPALVVSFIALTLSAQQSAPSATAPLHEVKAVEVDPTVVPDPSKVKDNAAPNVVEDSLKDALQRAGIQVAENAAIHAHLVLDEFSSGSVAKRMTVGFGAGRSNVECHLVLDDASGKEVSNIPIHVRGNKAFAGYEGNGTQKRQALSSLDQKLLEEVQKLK